MRRLTFADAIEDALAQAMAADERVIVFGEDVVAIRRNLVARFGDRRVRNTPISESAFVGAAVTAAMSGLRPVAELQLVDFVGVAMDAVLNHAAKVEAFSGGRWTVPMVLRASCGGGYGDGGQHEQSLWGWLAHIPGVSVVVPSTPADAGGLMLAAIAHDGPVVFLEHKLLADYWLDYLGAGGRTTVTYDIPDEGAEGPVPDRWTALPLAEAVLRRTGTDVGLVSVGVGVHRAIEAAERLARDGISSAVLDLRSVAPLDRGALHHLAETTGRLLVVDEDYRGFGLSGEIAATVVEAGFHPAFGRVCCETTIPYARQLEERTLPNVERIVTAARHLLDD